MERQNSLQRVAFILEVAVVIRAVALLRVLVAPIERRLRVLPGPVRLRLATAVLASSIQPGAPVVPGALTALKRLACGTTWAVVLMLISGVLIELATGGSFHDTWWFRASFFLLLALGALQGMSRRTLRKLEAVNDGRLLRGVVRNAWAMCAVVAVAAILIEVKAW